MSQPRDVHYLLQHYWGYTQFRDLQEDIIDSVLDGHDTVGLMPTGGGKSITFQVPTMAMEGLALVITPIISLMKDQVDNLHERNIKATYLHAGLSLAERRRAIERCVNGNCKFLYISPERLDSDTFIAQLQQMPVALIVVDEAHCISQWGYDFRPSFLKINKLRDIMPRVPVLALTATATEAVLKDIIEKLRLVKPNVFSKSFERSNLSYVVRHTEDKMTQLMRILLAVPGSAIVYVRSRKKTKLISDELNQRGVPSDYYHAGLTVEEKNDKQNRWKQGDCRVIVATNAFGMGIDKADVRTVVHIDVPNSIEEYYQEAGRAGRDGNRSYVVLLVQQKDKGILKRRVTEEFPTKDFIRHVYDVLGNFLQVAVGSGYEQVCEFNLNLFCKNFSLPVKATHNALKVLTRAGYVEYIEEIDTQSRVMITADKEELYDIRSHSNADLDPVLQAVLRLYTGLFADYVFINEAVISYHTGIPQETIYKSLITLTKMHVLHYVPRKRTPYIIYTTSREEPHYVIIPRWAYETLRERLEHRVNAMINYAYAETGCREAILLEYFGEKKPEPCHRCDLCIDRRKRMEYTAKDVQDGILYYTSFKPHTFREIVWTLSFPEQEVSKMISFLVDEKFLIHLPDDTYKNPHPVE